MKISDYYITIIFSFIIIAIIYSNYSETFDDVTNDDTRHFKIVFSTMWGTNGTDKMINFPTVEKNGEGPHTGNMFLIVHNDQYNLFQLDEFASKGIIESAQYGTNTSIISNLNNSQYHKYYVAPVLKTPGITEFIVGCNSSFPLLSFATMIAPSSNWFTGLSNLNLMKIYRNVSIPIYVYDAGVDYGTEFKNLPKNPRNNMDIQPISYLVGGDLYPYNLENLPVFGHIDVIPL